MGIATSVRCRLIFDRVKSSVGFTLIELLVVVLIIGILASVAVPQYQKAVQRARNTQLKNMMRAIFQAENAYYMANGQFSDNFDELDIDLPLTPVATTPGTSIGPCSMRVGGTDSVRQGDHFIVILNHLSNDEEVIATRWIDGKYKCTGFSQTLDSTMYCAERENHMTIQPGGFCKEIENGTKYKNGTSGRSAQYSLP